MVIDLGDEKHFVKTVVGPDPSSGREIFYTAENVFPVRIKSIFLFYRCIRLLFSMLIAATS